MIDFLHNFVPNMHIIIWGTFIWANLVMIFFFPKGETNTWKDQAKKRLGLVFLVFLPVGFFQDFLLKDTACNVQTCTILVFIASPISWAGALSLIYYFGATSTPSKLKDIDGTKIAT